MFAFGFTRGVSSSIPKVTCPFCGSAMRLATIEPIEPNDSTVTFSCECSYRYQLSERAMSSLARDRSDLW